MKSTIRLPLRAQLWLQRQNAGLLVAGLLCAVGMLLWLQLAIVHEQRAHEAAAAARNSRERQQQSDTVGVHAQALTAPDRFFSALGELSEAPRLLKPLFSLADKTGVIIERGDYQLVTENAGGFHVYRASLPLSGSYPAVRAYCEQVLRAMPFASIDQLVLQREDAGEPVLKAKLALSLYLTDRAGVRP